MGRLAQDLPVAQHLPAPARCRAAAPLGPAAEEAVHWRYGRAALRQATLASMARGCLLEAANAEVAVATAVGPDAPRAPLDAIARVRASAPGAPVREAAIDGRLTRDVGVADGHLAVVACSRRPTLSCHHLDLSRPERGAPTARLRAWGPSLPFGPLTVDARCGVARCRGTGLHLLAVLHLASLASVLRRHGDVPVTRTHAAPTAAAARAPLRPLAPGAVCHAALRVLAAGHLLRETRGAAHAARVPVPHHSAEPPLLPRAAGGGASSPGRPIAELAVLHTARHGIAATRCHELCGALGAAVGSVAVDLALPVLLAPTARLLALVPLRPLRDLAVHRLEGAGLRLLQVPIAGPAALAERLDGALTVALAIRAAARPGTPAAENAVDLVGLARRLSAHLHLLQPLATQIPAALSVLDDAAVPDLPASATGPCTSAPAAPLGQLAGLRVARL
mmetsp:Transcript_125524/g.390745  ORF Transcript_125524/g.390745 Transcript_125524/m.390745 type:complete len:450 (+) Transcript_125524:627-1976(+)